MIVWLDAHLPVALARWLSENAGVHVHRVRDMQPRPVKDIEILDAARTVGHVVVSKDEDFKVLVARLGPPPQIVHLTCGNLTKRLLIAYFEAHWPDTSKRLTACEAQISM